jgi:hypothetical protein
MSVRCLDPFTHVIEDVGVRTLAEGVGCHATFFAADVPEKQGDAAPADPLLAHSGAMLHAADSKFKRCFSFQGHVLVASEDRKVPSTIEHVPCFALSLGAIVTPNESSSTDQISESQNPIPRQQLGTVRMVSIVE